MADMASLLAACCSAGGTAQEDQARKQAEAILEHAESHNAPAFFLELSKELANNERAAGVRQMAALRMKQSLNADVQDAELRAARQARWASVDKATRDAVKNFVINTLTCAVPEVRSAAAQVVGKIAFFEFKPPPAEAGADVPPSEWPELLPGLAGWITSPAMPMLVRASSLTALTWVVEELDKHEQSPLSLKQVQEITRLVLGELANTPDPAMQLAGIQALRNLLSFMAEEFEPPIGNSGPTPIADEVVQHTIRLAAGEKGAAAQDEALAVAVTIAELFYNALPKYISALATMTGSFAMAKLDTEVAKRNASPALEFWEKIAVEEADRGPDEHRKFITTNLAPILGMLTSVMSSPDANLEDDDDGGWGPYQAAQNAFVEVTRAVGGSAMVGAVLPWVQQNIAAPEWQKREAASMVMGMLQEHTPGSDILTVDGQALHLLWPRLLAPAGTNAREAHDKVREGLVFFIAKAYLFHGPSLCPTKERVKEALANLCTLLASEAVPATRKLAATAINYLFTKFVQDRDEEGTLGALFERVGGAPAGPVTTVFSGANGIFDILTLLVRRGVEATAADETEVSVECFSAVNSVLEASGVEDVGTVAALLRDVGMAKLTESVAKCMPSVDRAPLSADAKHKERELQERYLGLVHTILNKEQEFLRADPPFAGLTAALTPLAQQLVSLVLALVDCDMASSEAWSVLGLLITSNLFSAPEDPPDRAGLTFWCRAEVLGAVHARIAKGLSSLEDADRLIQSFYSAGDVLRTLRERAPPELVTVYVDRAIAVLQDPNVDSVVKPVALEFFTDYAGCLCVARSILYRVLDKVDSAAQQENGNPDDEDQCESIEKIRLACCATWSAILVEYSQPSDARSDPSPAERQARVVRARQELLDQGKGGVRDIVGRVGAWAVAWQTAAQVGTLEDTISLELETAVLRLVIDLVCAVGLEVVQPIFGQSAPAIAWLAQHCHNREVEEEGTASAETFVNRSVATPLGLPPFPAPQPAQ